MFFIQFHVRSQANSPNAAKYGGAHVNCWVERDVLSEARATAIDMIHEAGWHSESVEDERQAYREEFEGNAMEYFDQALIDTAVCVFHTWPIDAPDANEER